MTVRAHDNSRESAARFHEHHARKLRGLAGRQPAPRDPEYVSPRQRCLDEIVIRHVWRLEVRRTGAIYAAVLDDFGSVSRRAVKLTLRRLVAAGDVVESEGGWIRARKVNSNTSNRAA